MDRAMDSVLRMFRGDHLPPEVKSEIQPASSTPLDNKRDDTIGWQNVTNHPSVGIDMDQDVRIIAKDQATKDALIAASRHIHDQRRLDTDIPMVNFIAHLYHNPDLVEIDTSNDPHYFLYRDLKTGLCLFDCRMIFHPSEKTYQMFVNGKIYGTGSIGWNVGEFLEASDFQGIEPFPQNIDRGALKLFGQDGQVVREVPLWLKSTEVEIHMT